MPDKNPPLVANLAGAILFFFVLLFIFSKWGPGIPFSVSQVTTNKSDFFSVTGEGRVETKPDSAETTVGFIGTGKTVLEAQTNTNTVINQVSDAVKKLGVPESDIKTTNYSVIPDFRNETFPVTGMTRTEPGIMVNETMPAVAPNPPGVQSKITGYTVNATLQITINNLDLVNDVIDTATKNGANQVFGVNFTLSNKDKVISEARKIAIDNAKKKANEIAGQAGITLGKIVNLYDNTPSRYGGVMMTAKAVPEASDQTNIEPGSTEVVVTVTLNYETR